MVDQSNKDKGSEKPAERRVRRKKNLPSVDYLLKHGDPETAHLPPTWFGIIGKPLALALAFAVSLLIFHHALYDKAPPRKKYTLPTMKRMNIQARKAPNVGKESEMTNEL
mmetsp:Transcript_24809/g.58627  ORF Transcript_24809/g.58627 Transcript_24809/m.58627 type:complete len:110 (-) Transcript_24809:2101-2430(-)